MPDGRLSESLSQSAASSQLPPYFTAGIQIDHWLGAIERNEGHALLVHDCMLPGRCTNPYLSL